MNAQFFDDLFNFLRVSFSLFYFIVFWYITFWKKKEEAFQNIKIYHISGLFIIFIINSLVFFHSFLGKSLDYLTLFFLSIASFFLFTVFYRIFKLKFYYLLLIPVLMLIFLFYSSKFLIFCAFFVLSFFFVHVIFIKNFPIKNKIKRSIFIFFAFYLLFLGLYFFFSSLFFNLLSSLFLILCVSLKSREVYSEKFRDYLRYSILFILSFSVLIYLSNKYINFTIEDNIHHKKLDFGRIALEIKDKIKSYSNFIKYVASSEDLKNKIKKNQKELNRYLSYLNQNLDTSFIYFADKNGNIKACSAEYREKMINKNIRFRKYFQESIHGNLSVFIGRGIYSSRADVRISYPIYDKGDIIGVLVFHFYIDESFKKQLNIKNAFVMHSSGGVLIGREELRNRLIFSPPEEELKKLYEEQIFGNDKLLPSGFKQIDDNILEDYKGEKWHIIKNEIIKDWFVASLVNLSFYERDKTISFVFLIILAFFSHYFVIRSFERLRTVFFNLAEEAEEKRIAFDAIDNGIIYTDAKGKIRYMNKEAMKILNVTEEAVGRDLKEILILKEHKDPEYKILHTEEREVPIIYTENPILIRGIKFGDIITIKDATEEIKKEEIEKRIERVEVISKISAGIVHDLNNYMMILTGNLSLLNEIEQDEKHHKLMKNILEATKLMKNTIEELKDLSPDFVPKKKPVNLIEIAKKSLKFLLDETKIVYEIHAKEPISKVYGDSGQIYRVFQNIIINAKQAMGQEGKIIVRLKDFFNDGEILGLPKGKFVFVSISDTGPGIPEEYIDKVFDPFFTMKMEGKGLGLNIVKGIIEKMGGEIEVESKIGAGTTFNIYLPALE